MPLAHIVDMRMDPKPDMHIGVVINSEALVGVFDPAYIDPLSVKPCLKVLLAGGQISP